MEYTYTRADGVRFVWNGSKTVNVYANGRNVDAFSLDYGRDHVWSEVIRSCDDWEVS